MDIAPFIYSSPTRSPDEDAPVNLTIIVKATTTILIHGLKSQNDDSSTGVARPPSLPGLLAASTVSSARSHITGERPPHNRTTPNIGSSSAKLGPLPFNGRTNFSRLDTDASDEIVDEEDDDEPLLTKLGKRDRSTQKQKGPSTPRVTRHVCLDASYYTSTTLTSLDRELGLVSKMRSQPRQVKMSTTRLQNELLCNDH